MSMKPSIDELKSDLQEFHGYIMKSQDFVEKVENNELALAAHELRLSDHEKKHEGAANQLNYVKASISDIVSRHDALEIKTASEFGMAHDKFMEMDHKHMENTETLKNELEMLRRKMSRNTIIQSVLLVAVAIALAVSVYLG